MSPSRHSADASSPRSPRLPLEAAAAEPGCQPPQLGCERQERPHHLHVLQRLGEQGQSLRHSPCQRIRVAEWPGHEGSEDRQLPFAAKGETALEHARGFSRIALQVV